MPATNKRKKIVPVVNSNETTITSSVSNHRSNDVSTADGASPKQMKSSAKKKKQQKRSMKQSKSFKKNIMKHIAKCANVNEATSSYFAGIEVSDTVFMPAVTGGLKVTSTSSEMEVDVHDTTDIEAAIQLAEQPTEVATDKICAGQKTVGHDTTDREASLNIVGHDTTTDREASLKLPEQPAKVPPDRRSAIQKAVGQDTTTDREPSLMLAEQPAKVPPDRSSAIQKAVGHDTSNREASLKLAEQPAKVATDNICAGQKAVGHDTTDRESSLNIVAHDTTVKTASINSAEQPRKATTVTACARQNIVGRDATDTTASINLADQPGTLHNDILEDIQAIRLGGVEAFVDVVDLSSKAYCGYNFILRIVDPKARYGHAIAMKSNTELDCITAIKSLLSIARVKPTTIFYDHRTSYLLKLGDKYPCINFFYLTPTDDMINDHNNYVELIDKWISDNRRDFLTGATVVQAVLNNMSNYS